MTWSFTFRDPTAVRGIVRGIEKSERLMEQNRKEPLPRSTSGFALSHNLRSLSHKNNKRKSISTMGVLTVVLDKIEHLRDKDGVGKSDPYVSFYLEQDNLVMDHGFGKQKSSVKKNETSPVYNETFTFEIPNLKNMKLWIKVLDEDVGRDDCLGKGHVDLEDFKPTSELKEIDIRVDNNIIKRDAVIYLKIKYEA